MKEPESVTQEFAHKLRFSFFGEYSDEVLAEAGVADAVLQEISEQADKVADTISRRLNLLLPAHVSVELRFEVGSFEWLGWIELGWHTAQPWLEGMSSVAGAWELVRIIRSTINSAIRKSITKRTSQLLPGGGRRLPAPKTEVILIQAPPPPLRIARAWPDNLQSLLVAVAVAALPLIVTQTVLLVLVLVRGHF